MLINHLVTGYGVSSKLGASLHVLEKQLTWGVCVNDATVGSKAADIACLQYIVVSQQGQAVAVQVGKMTMD